MKRVVDKGSRQEEKDDSEYSCTTENGTESHVTKGTKLITSGIVNMESVEELREHKGNSKTVALIRLFTPHLLSSMFFTKEIAKKLFYRFFLRLIKCGRFILQF